MTRWGVDFPCHDLSLSPDGKRAYVGWYAADVGHPAAVVGAFKLSSITGGRQHTETFTEIAGRKYVIAAEEGSCPGGNGRIVDVTDERNPVQVAEVPLGVNSLENCAAYRADTGSELLLYMSHYVSVDDPSDASLAFFTWYSSGLRVFDIRDPHNPREVAELAPHLRPPDPGGRRTWSVPPVTDEVQARTTDFDLERLLDGKAVKCWCTADVVPQHHS